MIASMAIQGSLRGERRRLPNYERGCGRDYRPGTYFRAANAEKLLDMCDATGLSVSGFLDSLIEWLPVDDTTGRPVGWPEQPYEQEEMPNVSGF